MNWRNNPFTNGLGGFGLFTVLFACAIYYGTQFIGLQYPAWVGLPFAMVGGFFAVKWINK